MYDILTVLVVLIQLVQSGGISMFYLDPADHRPLYEQIKEKLKRLMMDGLLTEHSPLPSVRELAVRLAINPNTIQKAYKDLEAEGFIYSKRGKGSCDDFFGNVFK